MKPMNLSTKIAAALVLLGGASRVSPVEVNAREVSCSEAEHQCEVVFGYGPTAFQLTGPGTFCCDDGNECYPGMCDGS